MTDKKIPAVWAINSARKRMGLDDEYVAGVELSGCIIHLALHIEDSEPAPISRELLCAREAVARQLPGSRSEIESGEWDGCVTLAAIISAIQLYASGFGEPNG